MFSTDLSTRSCDGYAVVALRGELDLADAAIVAAELTAVAAREPRIIVDLTDLGFLDSRGVAALERGRTRAWQAGGDLLLAAPQRRVMRVLDVICLAEPFSVYATVEEAAGEAGHFKPRAMPKPQRPRKARWPRTVTWSRTRGLRTCIAAAPHPGQVWRPLASSHPQQRVLRSERRHGCH